MTVVGHFNVDVILKVTHLPSDGTVPVGELIIRQGGTGANIAKISSMLGVQTKLISRISRNFPKEFIQELRDAGVELNLEVEGNQGPVCYIVETPEREIAFMYQGPMDHPGKLEKIESDYAHFATGDPVWILDLMKESRSFKIFDPGQELSYRWSMDLLKEASEIADLVIVNSYENELLGNLQFKDKIVTMGDKGCLYDDEIIPAIKTSVKTKVGAGDAFRAGLYFGLKNGMNLRQSCSCGNLVASYYISGNLEKLSILKGKKSCVDLNV